MSNAILQFLKHIWLKLYNLKQQFFHRLTTKEVETLKESQLFNSLNKQTFTDLLHATTLIRFLAGDRILKEGEASDILYIITEGSVRVFTETEYKEKIQLATLSAPSYFGEQAFLNK